MKRTWRLLPSLTAALLSVVAGQAVAQAPATAPPAILSLKQTAERAYDAGEWPAAVTGYGQLVRLNPDDGDAWLRLGRARLYVRDCRGAIGAYSAGIELGFADRARGPYSLARMYAQCGEREKALQQLRRSLDQGYPERMEIAGDEAFAGLSRDPEFQALVNPPASPADRIGGWGADLDYLTSEIRRIHYTYRTSPLPAAYLEGATRFRSAISAMSDTEATLSLQRLLATLGDGHTLVYPFGMERGQLHSVPVQFYLFKDGLYVIVAAQNPESLVGRRVVRIGALSADEALERVASYVSRDNRQGVAWIGPAYLAIAELLHAIGACPDPGRVVLTIEDRRGRRTRISLAASADPLRPEDLALSLPPTGLATEPPYLRNSARNFWFEERPDGLVYVQFNRVLDADTESIAAFSNRLQEALARPSVRGVILDVRRNNGGDATLMVPLLDTMVWFEREKGPGSIATIIGRNTFSAAQNFVSYLDMTTATVFIGEPTGSRPVHIGDQAMFRLPYSGVIGSIAPELHQDSLARDNRAWISPDVPVTPTYEDYAAGRDPALDIAAAVLTSRRRP